jgi:hypothetical protein
MRFERLVRDGGIENGKLYYNIGNAYFRMKDIGRAILNYRRAEQYLPNEPNLHQNLAAARQRRVDAIEERQRTRVLKTLFFWHYDLSPRLRGTLFAGAFALLWVGAAARLFLRRSWLNVTIGVLAIGAALLCGSVLADVLTLRNVRPGVIVSAEVVARKGDSETYEPSFKEPLHAGTEFRLVEDRGGWYHVALVDGRKCWIPSRAAEMVR